MAQNGLNFVEMNPSAVHQLSSELQESKGWNESFQQLVAAVCRTSRKRGKYVSIQLKSKSVLTSFDHGSAKITETGIQEDCDKKILFLLS